MVVKIIQNHLVNVTNRIQIFKRLTTSTLKFISLPLNLATLNYITIAF